MSMVLQAGMKNNKANKAIKIFLFIFSPFEFGATPPWRNVAPFLF